MEHADFTVSRFGVLRPASFRRLTIVARPERDAEAIVRAAFAPWARHYRKTLPKLYALVDLALSRPGRKPRANSAMCAYAGRLADCERCGADFPARTARDGDVERFCSPECSAEHRAYCKRRGITFKRRSARA